MILRSRTTHHVCGRVWILAVLAATPLTMLAACNPFTSPTKSFTIRVDSIVTPDSVGANDQLDVFFYGWIGSDQCSRVTNIEKQLNSGGLQIRFHGETRRGGCAQMPALLEHHERIAPPLTDPFTVTVVQPAGPPLIRAIHIVD